MSTCEKILSTWDLNRMHVNIIMLHVDTNKLHVNIIMLHVDIIYLACRGKKYATIYKNSSLGVYRICYHVIYKLIARIWDVMQKCLLNGKRSFRYHLNHLLYFTLDGR